VYDLVIVGGGSAGLTAAGFANGVGARAVLIERERTGGDCTWTGCMPSKTLVKAAKVAHHMRSAARYGLAPKEPHVDLASVMAHVQDVVLETYQEETPEVLRERGIDVILGEAHFVDPHTLVAGSTTLKARNVVIASGARPRVPSIEGLDGVDHLSSRTVWDLETLPSRFIVVGGGPVGCEMAQAFRRFGAGVTLLQSHGRLLPRDEPEASRTVREVFEAEGVEVLCSSRVTRAWQDEQGIHVAAGGRTVTGDALLVAVGRRPNVEGLHLEAADVAYSPEGIEVDDRLRTSQSHIFAVGDCLGTYQFTHYAGWQAAIAVRNALLPLGAKGVRGMVPWTTFTDPEVAHAGLTEAQARERLGDDVEAVNWPMARVDRARAAVDTAGFVKLVHRGGTVLGATVVCERAGESIQEWIYVMEHGLKLRDVATGVHVYPAFSRANAQVAGHVVQERILEGRLGRPIKAALRLMLGWMRWRRGF
jgi:pyruvate/2-oxoglutarate dehydrogenase complex dihydrolipoamide dehydrogenase (E3) component